MRSLNSSRIMRKTNRPSRERTPLGSTTVTTDDATAPPATSRPATNTATAATVPAFTAGEHSLANKTRKDYLYSQKQRQRQAGRQDRKAASRPRRCDMAV